MPHRFSSGLEWPTPDLTVGLAGQRCLIVKKTLPTVQVDLDLDLSAMTENNRRWTQKRKKRP